MKKTQYEIKLTKYELDESDYYVIECPNQETFKAVNETAKEIVWEFDSTSMYDTDEEALQIYLGIYNPSKK